MQLQTHTEAARAPHPEHESQWAFNLRTWYNAMFRPEIRLNVRFPFGLKEFGKLYAIAAVYYVVGSLVPILLIMGGVIAVMNWIPEKVLHLVATPDGHPNMYVVLATTILSFLCGFGAELYYINKQLRLKGESIRSVIALNLNSVNGSWGKAFRYAFVGLLVALALQNALDLIPMPKPHQATAELASSLDGAGIVGFMVLASILAPFFEEVIFRGFVFNAFRNMFSEGRIFQLIGQHKRVADYAAITVSALLFAAAHMDASAFLHLFVIGCVLAEVYRRSGTLVAPMMLHAMNNMVATILIMMSGKA